MNPPTPTPTTENLKRGSKGSAVMGLQKMLNACGYDCGAVDGVFGANTEKAVKAMQKANKISVDGIYGPASKKALTAEYQAKKGYLSEGDEGDAVKTMQKMLVACGYGCGKEDGVFGAKTAAALSSFRLAHKMTATPKYTQKVEVALIKEYSKVMK